MGTPLIVIDGNHLDADGLVVNYRAISPHRPSKDVHRALRRR